MAKRPEEIEENKTAEWATKNGITNRKMEWVERRGGPDRFFAAKDKCTVIEFKAPGKLKTKSRGLSPTQVIDHLAFEDNGYIIPVFDTAETAIEYLKEFFEL